MAKPRLIVWTQGPMARIFPDDAPAKGARKRIDLAAARGEYECAQIGLRTVGFRANYVEAEATDLRGPGGARISAANVRLLYPEYVPVKWPTAGQAPHDVEREPPCFFPDPLMASWQLVGAGPESPPTRSVWVRVYVPPGTRPGVYRGVITVRAGRRDFKAENTRRGPLVEASGRVPITVRGWDFDLPARPGMHVTNWFFPSHVAAWYGEPMWSADFWKLMGRFAEDMAAHRQDTILTMPLGGEQPGDQMVTVRRKGRGYSFDLSRFDRWCRLYLRKGFALIEGGHVASACKRGTAFWLTGAGGSAKRVEWRAQDARYEQFLKQFMRELWTHLGRRRWQRRYLQHISDEPGPGQFDKYKRLARIVREAAPGIELVDAIGHVEFAALIDHPVPLEDRYQKLIDGGARPPGDVWVYYCCGPTGPWPNRFVDYLLVRVRILTWLCFQKRIPGFLHWGYNYWKAIRKEVHNPWDDPTTHRHPAGDPMLVYPPRDGHMDRAAVTGSIRWEILREAMEDYEYLRMTRELAEAGDAQARAILDDVAERIAPDWTTHARDADALDAVRLRMGRLLAKRGGSAGRGARSARAE